MRSRRREVACVAAWLGSFTSVGACSLFSGWSDLQDGLPVERPDASAPRTDGAGDLEPSEPEEDAAVATDGASERPETGTASCTPATCPGEVCCASVVSAGTRTCAPSCGPTEIPLGCFDSRDCPGEELCCLQGSGSECRGTCAAVLCDATNPTCPPTLECGAGPFGLNLCR